MNGESPILTTYNGQRVKQSRRLKAADESPRKKHWWNRRALRELQIGGLQK